MELICIFCMNNLYSYPNLNKSVCETSRIFLQKISRPQEPMVLEVCNSYKGKISLFQGSLREVWANEDY